MPNIGAPELIIIAVVLVVLFGAAKLPTFARSVGRSMRIFKSEAKGLQEDDAADERTDAADDTPAAETQKELPEAKPQTTEDVTERRQSET